MVSAALTVSISALASSIIALMPRVMVWGIVSPCVPDAVRHSSCRSAEPGPYQTPVSVTAPALQRTASQVLRAALRPGNESLPHQLPHGAFESFDGDRVHALRKQPADDGGGFRIVPVPLRHRIEPDRMRVGAGDAREPHRAGLLVDVLDRAAR